MFMLNIYKVNAKLCFAIFHTHKQSVTAHTQKNVNTVTTL